METGRDIAIIGLSALFAGARDLRSYWQNILSGVDAVTEAAEAWSSPYFDPASSENDRIYTKKGGFLKDLAEFDPVEFGIMPNAVDGGEPDQYLALRMAYEALRDSGYDKRPFDRERAGIILGRGTYVNRGYTNLMQHGMMVDQTLRLLEELCPGMDGQTLSEIRKGLKEKLPPFAPDMLPGLVPNVVTGRIANRLNLMGPNFIIDAACASSLIAVELSIRELLSGRCDMVITGGVHASTPPQIYMIFCQINGLSPTGIKPFDGRADGTLLGEGLGLMVLKRLSDAERDGDRIYAVIKGVGTSSDGKALGLLAPRLEGEALALRRAYDCAGVDPATVGLVEAHGTGIPLGDQTEVAALSTLFGGRNGRAPRIALGSVKSMIGHCIPAAGAAGMIKAALALYHKILPPTLCGEVSPDIGIEKTPFYLNTRPRPWIHGGREPRRAGVNAFGFGGVNSHAVLEEYRGPGGGALLHKEWPSELFVFSAESREELLERVKLVRGYLERFGPEACAADLSYTLAADAKPGRCRLAIVSGISGLAQRLDYAVEKLKSGAEHFQARTGVYYSQREFAGKTAFLFPGEGSQYPDMLSDLCMHFPEVREWFDFLDETCSGRATPPGAAIFPPPTGLTADEKKALDERLFDMDLGSEAVFTASMAINGLLRSLGVGCDAMLGHSTGENTALIASGRAGIEGRNDLGRKMRELNGIYRDLEAAGSIPRGSFIAAGPIRPDDLAVFLAEFGGRVHLAMDNCPNQPILYVNTPDLEEAEGRLKELGAICVRLPFDRAYHTPLFDKAATAFRGFYDSLSFAPGAVPLYSCATADAFPDAPEEARSLAAAQWQSRVRFRETIETLHSRGFRIFIEVGPGANLTGFVSDILRGREFVAAASDSKRGSSLEQVLNLLARLFAAGAWSSPTALHAHRQASAIDLARGPSAVKRRNALKLDMPSVDLDSGLKERVRQRLKGNAGAPGPAEERQVPDRSGELMDRHFDLMQRFLEAQEGFLAGMMYGAAPQNPLGPADAGIVCRAGAKRRDWPLLGAVLDSGRGSITVEKVLDINDDLFLRDHTLGGAPSAEDAGLTALPVLPFTFSMEMIAEAACLLAGEGLKVVEMRELRAYRWLALDKGSLRLIVRAEAAGGGSGAARVIKARVYEPADGREILVFEGEVLLAEGYADAPCPMDFDLGAPLESTIPDRALYTTGMFHGPLLQGVTHIRKWSTAGNEADLVVLPVDRFFREGREPVFCIDPGLLDAAGQLVGYWLTEQSGSDFNCFPFSVGSVRFYRAPLAPGERVVCRGLMRFLDEKQITAGFDLLDSSGRVIARVEGWQDRYFRLPEAFYRVRLDPRGEFFSRPFDGGGVFARRIDPVEPEVFEASWGIWQRVLGHLVLGSGEREQWHSMSGKRRSEWLLGRIAAKDAVRQWALEKHGERLAPADIEIRSDAMGRPFAVCASSRLPMPEISITHRGGAAMAAAASGCRGIGIDLEDLGRAVSDDLIEGAFDDREAAFLAGLSGTARQRGALAMWSAREAAAKAAGTGLEGAPRGWKVTALSADMLGAAVERSGRRFACKLVHLPSEVVSICVAE